MTRSAPRPDGGLTLVELVVAIALLGMGVVAILSAYATLIVTGDRARKHGDVGTVIAAASAAVVDPGRNPYEPCASSGSYDPTRGITLPSGLTADHVTVTAVRYWDGTSFQATCYDDSVGSFSRLQEIAVRVESADGRVSEVLTVVKRGS
jgi:type II secretory pathway pseudopilin PulG